MIKVLATLLFTASIYAADFTTPLTGYDPNELLEKIFKTNNTVPRAGYGLLENQPNFNYDPGSGQHDPSFSNPSVVFQDGPRPNFPDNTQGYGLVNGIKKKRRRKKPRVQGQQYPGPRPGGEGFGAFQDPGYGDPFNRPPSPSSLASSALSAVTEALTSIALYDDYQCVPRLLCEAAAGGALGGSSLLQSVSGLQPLLTLLAAYNGISSNPLFVFGRAVFLGMSSKNNPGSCRYAYPSCPTDPEQLVHYLNNHNGGFFRFFNAPQGQNLQQFYNQLSPQGYGFYDPNQNFSPDQGTGHYGFQPDLYGNTQNYGSAYPHQNYGFNNIRFNDGTAGIQKRIQNKPASDENNDFSNDSKWTFPDGKYGLKYVNDDDYKTNVRGGKGLKFPEQKYPEQSYNTAANNNANRIPKVVTFPEVDSNRQDFLNNKGPQLFPEENNDYDYIDNDNGNYDNNYQYNNYINNNPQQPNNDNGNYNNNYQYNNYINNNRQQPNKDYGIYDNSYQYNNDNNNRQQPNNYNPNSNRQFSNNNYYLNHNRPLTNYNYQNGYSQGNYHKYNSMTTNTLNEPGVQTVYVVRGNGDPNRPEIIKLRPGETVH